jgi:hypothetical protein
MSKILNNASRARYTVADASLAWGYSPEHVRRLCREKQVAHTRRRGKNGRATYRFTAEQLNEVYVTIDPRRRA